MNKLVLSVLVVGALIGGHMVRATDEPTSGAAKGVVGTAGGAGEPLSAATERLFEAVKADNLAAVQAAITTGANLNAEDEYGETPLHDAAENGHLPVVEYLLAAGADPNAQTQYGHTPLHFAAQYGHLPVVEYLLAAGADPNAQTASGETPLHWAARNGHLPVVQCLLAAGADINVKDKYDGKTPLHYAAWGGHLPVVQYLIALPQVDLTLTNSRGETAQKQARRPDIIDAIGAAITARNRRWNPLRQGWLAVWARAASAAPDAPAGGGGSAGPGDDKSGYEEHKE